MSRLSSSYIVRRSFSRKVTRHHHFFWQTENTYVFFHNIKLEGFLLHFVTQAVRDYEPLYSDSNLFTLSRKGGLPCGHPPLFLDVELEGFLLHFVTQALRDYEPLYSGSNLFTLSRKRGGYPAGTPLFLDVELEGFEPSSKRGTNMLSTCVVSDWFSKMARPGRPNHPLSLRVSHRRPGAVSTIPDIPAPPDRLVSEKGQSGDVSSPQLLQG